MRTIIRRRHTFLIAAASVAAVLCCGCSDTSIGGAFGEQKHANRTAEHVHDWGDWTVTKAATCDAFGVATRTCRRDASHKETKSIPKLTGSSCNSSNHVHDWGEWVVTTPATCYEEGVETRTCKLDASHKDTRAIAMLTGTSCNPNHVHDWGDWVITTPATCEAAGMETRTCNLDANHKETQSIPKLTAEACLSCGNHSCRTVEMPDGKTWMAENLNYVTADSWCYGEGGQAWDGNNYVTLTTPQIQANCDTYGRLYTWDAAKTACPNGWHLPTRDEWNNLVDSVGGWSIAWKKLKSSDYWTYYADSYIGTDDYGFSALPGGYRYSDGYFYGAGDYGRWWTATEYSDGDAYSRDVFYGSGLVGEYDGGKSDGFSARCVQN